MEQELNTFDMNKVLSFPFAKLLKEKNVKIHTDDVLFYRDEVNNIKEHQIKNRDVLYNYTGFGNFIPDENEYQTYSIVEVVMWLYEKHKIWISVDAPHKLLKSWCFEAYKINDEITLIEKSLFNSPTEAYEAAIEYTLNNLINLI